MKKIKERMHNFMFMSFVFRTKRVTITDIGEKILWQSKRYIYFHITEMNVRNSAGINVNNILKVEYLLYAYIHISRYSYLYSTSLWMVLSHLFNKKLRHKIHLSYSFTKTFAFSAYMLL